MKRTVLITGATSGIGKAIAIRFAKEGYNIVFDSVDEDGESIAQQIATEFSVDHLFFKVNIADANACRSMVQDALNRFGNIDVLVNNAGIQFVSPVENFPDEKWQSILDVNLNSAFYLIKAVWPSMKEQHFGRIINMASAHGLTASPFKSAYVASKHALIGLTKTIALEGAEFGITCNAICPGYVHTPIVENQIPDQMKVNQMTREEVIQKIMLAKQAIKEFIPVELIAETALFLANEHASTLTGVSIPIDGGWAAG